MTRSTNMEHVEVLRDLSEVCRAAIKAGDWKVDGACDPDAALRRADAALASLSAPQPPAEAQACGCGNPACVEPWEPGCGLGKSEQHVEAQPVAWEWEYVGNSPYPRGQTVARALHEMDPQNPPYPETWRPTRPLIYGDTAPPSAPVGVEAKDAEIEALRRELDRLRGEHVRVRRDRNAAQARAERLAEALRPLANLDLRPDGFDKRPDDQTIYARDRTTITVGDVRRAQAALRDHDQEGGNP